MSDDAAAACNSPDGSVGDLHSEGLVNVSAGTLELKKRGGQHTLRTLVGGPTAEVSISAGEARMDGASQLSMAGRLGVADGGTFRVASNHSEPGTVGELVTSADSTVAIERGAPPPEFSWPITPECLSR